MSSSLLIGCGNLGSIILGGFLKKKKKLLIYEKNIQTIRKLKKSFRINLITDLEQISSKELEYILLCVKPKDSIALLKKLKKFVPENCILISFVAGLSIKKIKDIVGLNNIVRVMPNILVNVEESATGIFAKNLKKSVKLKIVSDFEFFGFLKWLRFEDEINFFTALYGGGPAYVFYFLQCLTEISVANGLSQNLSKRMVLTLLKGTTKVLNGPKIDLELLIDKVASKGGTTEKALKRLKNKKLFYKIINEAILDAKERSIEITKNLNSIKV